MKFNNLSLKLISTDVKNQSIERSIQIYQSRSVYFLKCSIGQVQPIGTVM